MLPKLHYLYLMPPYLRSLLTIADSVLPKPRYLYLMLLILSLVGCQGGETPVPTRITPEELFEEAGLPSLEEQAATQTAQVPTDEPLYTPTITPTPATPTPSATFTPSPSPSASLSAIQETEVFMLAYRTGVALTQTAQVPPTATETLTPTLTPTLSPTPSPTVEPTLEIAARVFPNQIIFASTRAGSSDIWLMNLDGSEPEPLVLNPDANELSATCSPTGQQFLFESDQSGDRELYLGNFGDDSIRPLTDTEGENYLPAWSPIRDEIAFVSNRAGQADIWLMDSGGGNLRNLTNQSGAHTAPTWSPDGAKLYYVGDRGAGDDLYVYDMETGAETQLTTTPDINEGAPIIDYDLETLAYIANLDPADASTGALWLWQPPANPRSVITAEGRVDTPAWIDNRRVLVSADLGGITHILLVDLLKTQQTILTNLGPINRYARPCFVDRSEPITELPTGVAPTPTPSVTPELITAFTAVINPAADWQTIETGLTLADLEKLLPNDYRLGAAQADLQAGLLFYAWTDSEGQIQRITLNLQETDGALAVSITSYTVNDLPADLAAVSDLPFRLREAILSRSITTNLYRLESLTLTPAGLALRLTIPPQ